jgi:cytoskeletal protein RodZ
MLVVPSIHLPGKFKNKTVSNPRNNFIMKHLKIQSKTKSSFVIITAFTLLLFISCSPAKQDSEQKQQVPVLPLNQEQTAVANPEPEQPVSAETTAQPTEAQESGEVMMNPPHGEPFHRCDIPVGAPLNSAPAGTTRQTTSNPVQTATPQTSNPAPTISNNPTAPTLENAMRMNSGQTQTTSQTNNNTGTKPRLNPAHGQPWHRCDIAVGSPLP